VKRVRIYILAKKEDVMKKLMVLVGVVMFMVVASAAMADESGESKAGRLFLFQKCDGTLANTGIYDSSGCPNIGTGPWPIFPDKGRWGKLDYSLWGDTFKFSFSGRGLPPDTNYTLIYYPDPWPGDKGGLICLGSGQTTPAGEKGKGKGRGRGKSHVQCGQEGGNIQIHGNVETFTSLPTADDANYNPVGSSGAVGAKIWLVLSDDVQCANGPRMLNWNPTEYLFEYNLIVFEHRAAVSNDDDDDDDD
jgi:hypothetical protein